MDAAISTLQQRLNTFGGDVLIERSENTIVITLEGAPKDEHELELLVGRQGVLYLRPVLSCTVEEPSDSTTSVPSDPDVQQVLHWTEGYRCTVGPAGATSAVFEQDAQAIVQNGSWMVVVGLRPGADGVDPWNALAADCYSGSPTCPPTTLTSEHGQLAVELDGEIISAPEVLAPEFAGDVMLAGSFTESEAKYLASVLMYGAIPFRLELESITTGD